MQDILKNISRRFLSDQDAGLNPIINVLGVNIMPFIAGAGVAGIAIGFAAKDTLSEAGYLHQKRGVNRHVI